MQLTCSIILWIYLICLPFSFILTVIREINHYKVRNAPNMILGFIYHLITVWAITPLFGLKLIINKIKS